MHSLVGYFNRGCDKEERRTSQEQNHPMWLSDNGKQAFMCAKRQHLDNTSQKGPSGYLLYCCKERLDLMRSCFEFVKVSYAFVENVNNLKCQIFVKQPLSQGLSSLPPLVVRTESLVAAGHVTTQNLGGRKICCKGGLFYRPLDQMYLSTHPPCGFG